MNQQAVIATVGLTKVFKDFWRRARVKAVSELDLEIHPGEIFGLLGPNGSGKSTTIKMILGLLHPTRGRISVFGRPPNDVKVKKRIGYLPEESYLYRFLNARETLDYFGTLFQLPRRERRRRTDGLLEMVGLRSAARRPVGEYSKGMARRIGLAQALINDPDLLILDEPTSGLDPLGAKLVKDIIVRLGRVHHKTILLSSHLLADVEEVCDRMTILYGGRVQVSGPLQDVLAQRDRVQITCERLDAGVLREVQQLLHARAGQMPEISPVRDRLETLFLRIVQEAHARRVETAGSAGSGEIAEFLGETDQADRVLESLVRMDETAGAAAVEAAPAVAPAEQQVDAEVLQSLAGGGAGPRRGEPVFLEAEAASSAEPAAAPPRPSADVDVRVLKELTGDSPPEDRG